MGLGSACAGSRFGAWAAQRLAAHGRRSSGKWKAAGTEGVSSEGEDGVRTDVDDSAPSPLLLGPRCGLNSLRAQRRRTLEALQRIWTEHGVDRLVR